MHRLSHIIHISSAEKSDLLQKRPADDGAGAVTGVGVLPGQRGESESQHGHADVLPKKRKSAPVHNNKTVTLLPSSGQMLLTSCFNRHFPSSVSSVEHWAGWAVCTASIMSSSVRAHFLKRKEKKRVRRR